MQPRHTVGRHFKNTKNTPVEPGQLDNTTIVYHGTDDEPGIDTTAPTAPAVTLAVRPSATRLTLVFEPKAAYRVACTLCTDDEEPPIVDALPAVYALARRAQLPNSSVPSIQIGAGAVDTEPTADDVSVTASRKQYR